MTPPEQQLGMARLAGGSPSYQQQSQGEQRQPGEMAAKAPVITTLGQTIEKVALKFEHAGAHLLHGDTPLIQQGGQQQQAGHRQPPELAQQGANERGGGDRDTDKRCAPLVAPDQQQAAQGEQAQNEQGAW